MNKCKNCKYWGRLKSTEESGECYAFFNDENDADIYLNNYYCDTSVITKCDFYCKLWTKRNDKN